MSFTFLRVLSVFADIQYILAFGKIAHKLCALNKKQCIAPSQLAPPVCSAELDGMQNKLHVL